MEKVCKQCNNNFEITADDQSFYEKMYAPIPSYCWGCRMQRRLAHRNERTLYRRTCDATGKSMVSIYPKQTPWPVYQADEWWKDTWDATDFAQDYDPNRSFVEQWIELRNKVPRIGLLSLQSTDSEFTNNAGHNKNCYLIFAADDNEDCMYGKFVHNDKMSIDCAYVYDSERCYECVDCSGCNSCMYSEHCQSSVDLLFCYDCRNCQNCILSSNLRNKKYCINNEQYTKEEYEVKKKQIMATYSNIQKAKAEFETMRSQSINKFAFLTKCKNVTGDYLYNCFDSQYLFDVEDAKDCAYIADSKTTKECRDCNNVYHNPEFYLDVMSSLQCKNCKHCSHIFTSSDLEYCDSCHASSDLFGCIGMRNKKYCILNKQYEKEEYEALKAKIIEDMTAQGIYGDFLPPEASSFGYNETLASEYWPMDEQEAKSKGYNWQDQTGGVFGKETITTENMPETIDEVTDDILNETLVDEVTGQNFRITAGELSFYRQMGIPLPRRSFETRHQDRVNKRNPRKLWQRTTEDGKEVWTAYAPDRPETILSEEEYQQRVG